MTDSPAFYEERLRLLKAENQQLREALRGIAQHDLHVDYADCVLRNLARDALAAVGE